MRAAPGQITICISDPITLQTGEVYQKIRPEVRETVSGGGTDDVGVGTPTPSIEDFLEARDHIVLITGQKAVSV